MTTRQNADYGYDIQKLYLEMMLNDAETFVRCQSIFDHELFDRKLQSTAKFVNDYVTEHNVLPTYEIVNAATRSELAAPGQLKDEHYDWLLQDFETFIRHKGLERAILKSADLLEKGEYGPVEDLVKQAVQIGLTKDLGTDYFADPRSRLLKIKDKNGQISSGWPTVDKKLFGGMLFLLFFPQFFVFSVFHIQNQGDSGVQDYEQDDVQLLVGDTQHFAQYLHDFYTDPEDCIHLGGQI